MSQPSLLGARPITIIRNYERSRERNLPREPSPSRERNWPRERSRSRERNWPRERSRSRERNWPRERSRSRERNWPLERHSQEYYRPVERTYEPYVPECNNTLNGKHCYNFKCMFKHPRGYTPGPRVKCSNYPNCKFQENCKFGHWMRCPYSNGDFQPITQNYSTIDVTTMPKVLKQQVWDIYNGASNGTALCFCCKHVIIRMDDFQAGHIIAKSKGGSTDITNLVPICARCNKDMKTRNLYEYQAIFHPQKPSDPMSNLAALLTAAVNPS